MQFLFFLSLAVLGLVVGSFLAAYTYRYPRAVSIAKGRSVCDSCKKQILWVDNIPLVSFLFLGGKCRSCSQKISIRYPLIEGLTGAIFLAIGLFKAPLSLTLFMLLISLVLICVFVIDLENQIIPDELIYILLLSTYFFLFIQASASVFLNIFVGFATALFFLGIHLLTRGKGMGLGDVKFAIFAGSFFGWPKSLIWTYTSFLTGAFVGIILILMKKVKFGRKIAFGPYLVISFFLIYFLGETLKKWLISF